MKWQTEVFIFLKINTRGKNSLVICNKVGEKDQTCKIIIKRKLGSLWICLVFADLKLTLQNTSGNAVQTETLTNQTSDVVI